MAGNILGLMPEQQGKKETQTGYVKMVSIQTLTIVIDKEL